MLCRVWEYFCDCFSFFSFFWSEALKFVAGEILFCVYGTYHIQYMMTWVEEYFDFVVVLPFFFFVKQQCIPQYSSQRQDKTRRILGQLVGWSSFFYLFCEAADRTMYTHHTKYFEYIHQTVFHYFFFIKSFTVASFFFLHCFSSSRQAWFNDVSYYSTKPFSVWIPHTFRRIYTPYDYIFCEENVTFFLFLSLFFFFVTSCDDIRVRSREFFSASGKPSTLPPATPWSRSTSRTRGGLRQTASIPPGPTWDLRSPVCVSPSLLWLVSRGFPLIWSLTRGHFYWFFFCIDQR